ncbi:MAG: hypothetical protein H6811_09780 [Phycisphaeraceae bacterium]|nr:hypothetical protein [Phycisphaeraceae bacterium]
MGIALWTLLASAVVAEPFEYGILARTGDLAPGTAGRFSTLHSPSINDAGDIVFGSSLYNGATGSGIWLARSGVIEKVLVSGDAAPEAEPPGTFSDWRAVNLDNAGNVAFWGKVEAGDTDPTGIWRRDDSGTLRRVVQTGMDEPGAPGFAFTLIGAPALHDGIVVFYAEGRSDTALLKGVFWGLPGTVLSMVRTGDQVPDLGATVVFKDITPPFGASGFPDSVACNDGLVTAFRA